MVYHRKDQFFEQYTIIVADSWKYYRTTQCGIFVDNDHGPTALAEETGSPYEQKKKRDVKSLLSFYQKLSPFTIVCGS